ncbi:4'-phosphopantetheinyl transferase superfamily protein [Paenibacillus pasadenensis]|uniref:4'-phosphopantetheinyl transferase family protein n=1 Tax=Paenibacillus pasadenensis TaxID=217090 RepID=UPI00203E68FB|nr:4'-phosphopantetheinyl transferase superfamily protein [Paenibacillus pasadenensis]
MIEVYMLQLDERKAAALYPVLLNYVSAERREAAGRYRKPIDAYRSLTGEILARLAVRQQLRIPNDELVFVKNAYGKPMLSPPAADCHFNVSHAGSWVVCAFGDSPVGVDVERIKPIDISIAERFFAPEEYAALTSLPEQEQLRFFYQLWTLKESYIKAVGKGLSIPLDSFSFTIAADGKVSVDVKGADVPEVYVQQLFADDFHPMAVCAFNETMPVFRELSMEELEGMLPLLDQVLLLP